MTCQCQRHARCADCMERDGLTRNLVTAFWAFKDTLLALTELGHPEAAQRLEARWPELEDNPGDESCG